MRELRDTLLTCLLAGLFALAGCASTGPATTAATGAPAPTSPAVAGAVADTDATADARVVETALPGPAFAGAPIRLAIHLPPHYDADDADDARFPVLYVNDGQDMAAVGLASTLRALRAEGAIRDLIVVAIHMPSDRMGAYGLSDRRAGHPVVAQTRYGPVGTHAHAYSEWIANTLVPHVDAHYRTRPAPDARAILGWSLGALNAFNLGWQYPDVFGRVGAFSPSFWLAADRSDAQSVQRTRLAQRMVDAGPPRTGLKLFLAVGTDEERDDRDGDGLHDALDDTRDLVLGWQPGNGGLRGLAQLGYSTNPDHATAPDRADVALHLLPGGKHDQPSWARMLPVFLRWAYPPGSVSGNP
jgi:enterochelin esterase-like enzyme